MQQTTAQIDWKNELMGEHLLFGLLGKVLYTELNQAWLQTLIDEDVFSESPFGAAQIEVRTGLGYLQTWKEEIQAHLTDEAFLNLRTDNTRLFVGIEKVLAPMWESVYFSEKRMVFQEETLQVRNWYRRFKLESEKLYQEPDDHIGLELAFVAFLAQLGFEALEQNDEAAFQHAVEAQRFFLSEHVCKWVFHWCELVDQHSRTNFYRGLSHLVAGALHEATALVGAKLPEETHS